MCPTATPSSATAQMLASPTSKQGRDREDQGALLRIGTRPECPEGNLRELAWDSNPDCDCYPTIPWKALTTARHAHRTKDWAELSGCGPAHPQSETGRQGQPEPEGGNCSPREASYTKLQADFIANPDFLGFWTVDIRWEGHSQNQLTRREKARPLYTQKIEWLGRGRG